MSTGGRLSWFDERGRHDATPLTRASNVALARLGSPRRPVALRRRARPAPSAGRPAPRRPRCPGGCSGARLTWMDTTAATARCGGHHRRTADRDRSRRPHAGLQAGRRARRPESCAPGTWTTTARYGSAASADSRCFKGGGFATVDADAGPPLEQVTAIIERRRGRMWTARAAGCFASPRPICIGTSRRQASRCRWPSSTRPTAWPATRVGTGTAAPSSTTAGGCGS